MDFFAETRLMVLMGFFLNIPNIVPVENCLQLPELELTAKFGTPQNMTKSNILEHAQ